MAEIKRWNGSAWEVTYPKTTAGNIVASGTPSSTTFLRGDGTWATPASGATDLSVGTVTSTNVPILSSSGADITTLPAATASLAGIVTAGTQDIGGAKTFSNTVAAPAFEFSNTDSYLYDDGDLQFNIGGTDYAVYTANNSNIGTGATNYAAGNHTHGNISNTGTISSTATIASGDRLIIGDAGTITQSSITFGTETTTFLANNGTWQTPAGGGGATVLYDDYTSTLVVDSTSYSTPTDTPELSLSANKKYYVRCMGTYDSSALGTGLGLSAYFSSSTDIDILGGKLMVMDSGTTSGVTSEDTAPWENATIYPGSNGNSMLATTGPGGTDTYFGFDGFVSVGGTATTLKIAFRTEVSATSQYIRKISIYAVEVV